MSWIKENYEKAALGGAAAILLGVVGVSVLGGGDKLTAKQKSFDRDDTTDIAGLVKVATVLEERSTPAKIITKTEGPRRIDLFVGQKLYVKGGVKKPIDIYDGENVHEGIPNIWWLNNDIDLTFANAPERDFDKDGFTNREEYEAKTSPTDASKHPSPLVKLVARDVNEFKMQMRWSVFDDTSINITYQDNKGQRLRERVLAGTTFFEKGNDAVKGRFKLGAQLNGVMGPNNKPQDAYEVEDTLAAYKGTARAKFTLFKRGAQARGFNQIEDRSVQLVLNALGEEAKPFTLSEYQTFSLPFDPAAKVRPYKVESIKPKNGNSNQYVVTVSSNIDGEKTEKELTVSKR